MDFGTIKVEKQAKKKRVRTRFAPSPTGSLHIGGLRTALVCYIVARRFNGDFILRIEDTDRKRYVKDAVDGIISGLKYFGIEPDESPEHGGEYGPYTQSERLNLYTKAVRDLAEKGAAYKCYMSEEHLAMLKSGDKEQIEKVAKEYHANQPEHSYEEILKTITSGIKHSRWFRAWPANANVVLKPLPGAEKFVWRFAAPYLGRTTWKEPNGSPYSFSNDSIKDAVLLKADGYPTYHLAHVVDDNAMKISHVIRGSEWLPSTPLHLAMWKAFGYEQPEYIHLPVILNPDGKGKLSKRHVSDNFFVTSDQIISSGLNPDAVNVWLLQNIRLLDDHDLDWRGAIKRFSFRQLPNTKPGAISLMALNKIISRIGRNDDPEKFVDRLAHSEVASRYSINAIRVAADFMKTRNTGEKSYEKYMDFLTDCGIIEFDDSTAADWQMIVLSDAVSLMESGHTIEETINSLVEKNGRKSLGVLRYAVSHRHVSIPAKECVKLLGIEKSMKRIQFYVERIAA
jgi:glutamyl/glutaminyl-tRNA synthetase